MSEIKNYTISTTFRKASNRSLVHNLPSDLVFTFGAALYDKAGKKPTKISKEFFNRCISEIIRTAKTLKKLEEKYAANR